jgi:ribosome-binding factor A
MGKNIKGPSNRQLKVGELLRQALSDVLTRNDLYGAGDKNMFVTVSEVRISPDLRNATVFVMPLGGENKEEVFTYFEKHNAEIRYQLNKHINLKYSPALYFKLDESYETAAKIEALFQKPEVKRDLTKEEKAEAELEKSNE